jgi:hypothetical protein
MNGCGSRVAPALLAGLLAGCGAAVDADGRTVAEWVAARGGSVVLTASDIPYSAGRPLPAGEVGVREISLPDAKLEDRDLERFAGLKHLESLQLHGNTKLSDAGIEPLARHARLRDLDLSYTGVTDASLKKLGDLSRLKRIQLRGTTVGDAALDEFRKQHPSCEVVR